MDPASELSGALKAQALANLVARKALEAARGTRTNPSQKYFVYALLLQGGKIYVGQTDNPFQRFFDHFTMSRSTSQWIKMHGPPVRILEIIADAGADAENAMTLSYISKFGHDAVRGGSWHAAFAPPPQRAIHFRPGEPTKSLTRAEIEDIEAEVRRNIAMMHSPSSS